MASSSFKSAYILDNYFSCEQQTQELAKQAIPGTVLSHVLHSSSRAFSKGFKSLRVRMKPQRLSEAERDQSGV